MKKLMIVLSFLALASCGSEADADAQSSDAARATDAPKSDKKDNAIVSDALPDFSVYPRECPRDWGIVVGATQDHVVMFIQNYFNVPKGGPSPMYSEINTLTAPGGATVIKAGTYNMLDPIVDQEMVASFTAGKMTQCGSRLRCETGPDNWVASCD